MSFLLIDGAGGRLLDDGAGGWLLADSPVAPPPARFYGDAAAWNVPAAGIPTATAATNSGLDSATLVSRLLSANPFFKVTTDGNTFAIFEATPATPLATLNIAAITSVPQGTRIPWDRSWVPSGGYWDGTAGDDAQAVVLLPWTGKEYDLWQVTYDAGTNVISCTHAHQSADSYLTGLGVRPGVRSIGVLYSAMTALARELAQGHIDHALAVGIPDEHSSLFYAPAISTDGGQFGIPTGVPAGSRFALSITDAQIETFLSTYPAGTPAGFTTAGRIIIRCLRDYGFVITDNAGAAHFWFEDVQSGGPTYAALGMAPVTVGGKPYPSRMVDGLFTTANLRALVPSDQYPSPPPPPPAAVVSLGGAAGLPLAGDVLAFVVSTQAQAKAEVDAQRAALQARYVSLPPPQRLRFLPPARAPGAGLLVVSLTAGATALTPTATQDVLAVLPAGGWAGTLSVTGGRNLYLVGGVVDPTPTTTVSVAGRTLRGVGPIVRFQPAAAAVAPALYLWGLLWRLSQVDFCHCVQVGSPVASTDPVEVLIGNTWAQRLPGTDAAAGSRSSFLSFVPGRIRRARLWSVLVEGATDQALLLRPSDAAAQTPWPGVGVGELYDVGVEYDDGFAPVLAPDPPMRRSTDPNGLQLQVDSASANSKGWHPIVLKEAGAAVGDGYGAWLTPDDPGGAGSGFVDPGAGAFAPSADANGDLTWPSTLAAGMAAPIVSGTLRVGPPPVDLCDKGQDFDGLRVTTAAQLDAMIGAAPVQVAPDSFTVAQDSGATTLDVLANDTAPATLTISAVTPPAHGSAGVAAGGTRVTYTPAAGYSGADGFGYTATDGRTSASTSVAVTVTQVLAVTAVDDSASTQRNNAVTVDILANDSPSGLDFSILAAPTHGAAARVTASPRNTLRYTPATGYTGADSLTYKAFFAGDPSGPSGTARVGLVVTAPGSYRSGLAWASGLTPSGDTLTYAGIHPNILEWEAFRGRKVDVFQSKHNTQDFDHMLNSLKQKAGLYQGLYNDGICIAQVFDFIPDKINGTTNAFPQNSQAFKDVANGNYDTAWFVPMLKVIDGYNRRAPYILRVGHEADGTGGTAITNDTASATRDNWRAAWEHISDLIRAHVTTPPLPYIDLNFMREAQDRVGDITKIVPASAKYDVLSVDFYYNKSAPALASAADWDAWSASNHGSIGRPNGFRSWIALADDRGKRCALPEWAVTTLPGSYDRDNKWYIDGIFRDCSNHSATMLYDAYFMGTDQGKDHNLNSGPRMGDNVNPKATAQYVASWKP